MKKYTFCACLCALALLLPVSVSAETYISNEDHDGPVWNEAGSPYIVDDAVTIGADEDLTIEPGTSIIAGSSSDSADLYFDGDHTIEGNADKPIVFSNVPEVYLDNGNFILKNSTFQNTPLGIYNATATIDHISSSGADTAITVRKSNISATELSISGSTMGIDSVYARPVLVGFKWIMSRLASVFASIMTPKALAQVADDPAQSHVAIHDSSFEDTKYAIYNSTSNTVHAENDWWGSDAGPGTDPSSAVNSIYGPVSFDPWQGKATSTPTSCCSSILFIPGLEASRLAVDKHRVMGTSTDQLWEPISNLQVQGLYLNSSGDPIQQNIHPSGLVDTALAIQPIYHKFIDTMNDLVAEKTIAGWQPYPYDWRQSLTKVEAGTIGTSTAVRTIEQMASSSKTGKVTMIAHSNGGLVTKLLYDQLKEKGEANLVDKIIFVAVPEVGTPQALPSLLHGDSEEIADGLILSASTARGLGVNMPSAYSLLPDQNYFKAVPQAIISFASSTLAGLDFSKYFPSVTSYSSMKSFINDSSHGSLSDSTNIPIQGNAGLFPQAESIHATLDAWKPATSTAFVAIAGWGLPTDIGVSYFQKIVCAAKNILHLGRTCSRALQFADISTLSGDGTVEIQSALYSPSTKNVFDEGSYDKENGKALAHADILEADPVIATITNTIKDSQSTPSVPYMYDSIPTRSLGDELTMGIHSPATIDMYDQYGNHTGPIVNPIAGSDLDAYENKIPGSFYKEEGDQVYITLPYSPGYSIDINGTGIGDVEVTTDVQDFDSGKDISSSTFADIPVTPITHMEFAASTSTDEADSYQVIKIDEDGDGFFDATATPNLLPNITADSYKDSLIACIRALHLSSNDEKNLLTRFNKAWKFAQSDKSGKADKALANLGKKRIKHINASKITDQNRTEMRGLIEGMLDDMGM